MPLYPYDCKSCGEVYEINQGMNDHHGYTCPRCGQETRRIFKAPPQVKKNSSFFSDDLGREVSGQTDLQEGLDRQRYINGMSKWVGDNQTPKDEWVEAKEKARQEELASVKAQENEVADMYPQFYDNVETYE